MIRIRNRAMARMLGAERKRSGFRNGALFSILAAGAAVLAGITGANCVTVMAADDTAETVNVENISNDESSTQEDATSQVYNFKDNKTTGTVTVTKVWDDGLTNDEREIPDIKISTKKPSKSTLGYTVTFHGNGLKFADGSETNEIVLNSSGQIVSGTFKVPGTTGAAAAISWYGDEACKNRIEVSDNGVPQMTVTGDLDLWAKEKTFEIKGWKNAAKNDNEFNALIPDTVTSVIFTNEVMPNSATLINVDADGDGGVVAWTEENNTVMKVSTQIKGAKVQAAERSSYMFCNREKIVNIDLSELDTQNVTSMYFIFGNCCGLTSLDLSLFNTQNVTNMSRMFEGCSGLTSLNLSQFNTQKVTNMSTMFFGCKKLTSLDLSSFDTQNVVNMNRMFHNCSSITSLDLSSLNTQNVTNMGYMFGNCSGLTSLDLSPLNTQKVTDMSSMFYSCSRLKTLKTGNNFKFIGTSYSLSGTWRNTAGETFTSGTFPSNVADTYTKISN